MADALNEMVSIYPPQVLCPQIADTRDENLQKHRYYEYLTATFNRHAQGPMVRYGEYYRQYADYYSQKLRATKASSTAAQHSK